MTAVLHMASGRPAWRVLVLGQSAPVLETVISELGALGYQVSGSLHPATASATFDASDFDLIAFGGGVPEAVRSAAKYAFVRQNPAVRLLDTYAPIAPWQIAARLDGRADSNEVDLAAYGARVGFAGTPAADLATLRALHELHPAAIPFEAIDVMLGRGIDLAPAAVDAKMINARRGGYCFEQNGLFQRMLTMIGFEVEGLAARVRWNVPPGAPPPARTHMVLKVILDGVPWLADVGFGTSLPMPLRLDRIAPQATGHEVFRVFPFGTSHMVQIWRDDAWRSLYEVSTVPQYQADYELTNWFTSTHPASPFKRDLIVARVTPEARCTLLNNRLTLRPRNGDADILVLDAAGIEAALAEIFDLPVEPTWRPAIDAAAMR